MKSSVRESVFLLSLQKNWSVGPLMWFDGGKMQLSTQLRRQRINHRINRISIYHNFTPVSWKIFQYISIIFLSIANHNSLSGQQKYPKTMSFSLEMTFFQNYYCNSVTFFPTRILYGFMVKISMYFFFFLLAVTEQKTNSLAVKNPKKNGDKNNNNKRH